MQKYKTPAGYSQIVPNAMRAIKQAKDRQEVIDIVMRFIPSEPKQLRESLLSQAMASIDHYFPA